MEKQTAFVLIPTTKHTETSPETMMNIITSMVGTLNCIQPDDTCKLIINYYMSEKQRNKIISICNENGYECVFITASNVGLYIIATEIEL